MSTTACEDDLLGACRVLFGAGVHLDQRFLAQLDADTVRRRFRKRAVEVHPDRAAVLRRHPAVLAEAFKEVEAAYRTLCIHLGAGKQSRRSPSAPPPRRSPAPPARASDAQAVDHRWSGPIPSRTLRLGEFLYYSGRISWLQLIAALAWQAQQRTRFGQVARRFGYLTPDRVAAILAYRRADEKIGEAALRLRFMTGLQQQVVLHAQQRGSRRIGDYFVDAGLVAPADLERFAHGVRAHNARVTLVRPWASRAV